MPRDDDAAGPEPARRRLVRGLDEVRRGHRRLVQGLRAATEVLAGIAAHRGTGAERTLASLEQATASAQRARRAFAAAAAALRVAGKDWFGVPEPEPAGAAGISDADLGDERLYARMLRSLARVEDEAEGLLSAVDDRLVFLRYNPGSPAPASTRERLAAPRAGVVTLAAHAQELDDRAGLLSSRLQAR